MTDERKDQLTAEADGLIEGRNAVIEALRTEASIDKIFIQKGEVDKTLGHIASKARAAGIVVVEADRRKLDGMSRTHAHQGVIALAAVFFLTNRVSRSDYEEALVQTQALESSYTAINEEFSSAASATDNDSSSAYDEGKKKLKTFKQDSDKLAAMKAVKKDKDVKEKYETFERDRAKYERYMNDLAQTMPALMKMTHTCTKLPKFDSADMSSYYRDLSKALESCAADAGDLAKVPIKSYAEYGADMQESVSKKKDIVDQMADLNLNDIEYGSADYEKLQDLHAKMSDIDSPTLDQSDLQKAAKEADLSGSLKDLETTLSEKIK